jgi:outer membrane protein assembly factor BamB
MMKTKLTLFVTVLAVALIGVGCASLGTNPNAGKVLWKHEWKDGMEPYYWALSKSGHFYATRYHGNSIALDADNGKQLAEFPGAAYSVVIADNGVAYYGKRGSVHANPIALALKGGVKIARVKWDFSDMYTGNVHAGTSHISVGRNGTVYIGYLGDIWALDGIKGTVKWRVKPIDVGIDEQYLKLHRTGGLKGPISAKDGTIYTSTKTKLFALNEKTGELLWEYELKNGSFNHANSAISEDGVLLVSVSGKLVGLDGKTGKKKWETKVNVTPEGSIITGEDGTVYFGARSGFYAFDGRTGDWKWDAPSVRTHLGGAIDSSGVIYVAVSGGEYGIKALNSKDGKILWEYHLPEGEKWNSRAGIADSPLIGEGGKILFSSDKALYAIQGNGSGPAKSSWPMRGQNAQRTNRAR